jgi:prephenate dehydrogenase
MTGLERSGPEAASAALFEKAPFFLCPISSTPADAVPRLTELIIKIGSTPHIISAEDHDQLVAQLSHLPQILSTLLADQTSAARELAGPGWKSLTRLAASPFHVWRDILATSGYLPRELKSFVARLEATIAALEVGDVDNLRGLFERANEAVSEPATDAPERTP